MNQEFRIVGKRVPRPDSFQKVTGAARYTGDERPLGMLVGRVIRSPYSSAWVTNIDVSRAQDTPGVEAVITFKDVPKTAFTINLLDLARPSHMRAELQDQHVLTRQARFVGDAVAAIAAINSEVVEEAAEKIEIDYDVHKSILDPLQAIDESAPRVHSFAKKNIADHVVSLANMGEIEKGLRESDFVLEETFVTSRQKHAQLEPTSCIASLDFSGKLTIWSPCQLMHLAKRQIAYIFDIPEGHIRWITPSVGGAFGQRLSLTNEPICVALTLKIGKPVKIEDTREEDFLARESRQPFIEMGKIGVRKDGKIKALEYNLIADAGAYFTHSGFTTSVNMMNFTGLYRCPNTFSEAHIVYTNTPITGGMRGYGNPEAIFALEQLVDIAAEKVGLDPMEFRLRNIKEVGEPSPSPAIPIESTALRECILKGAERIGWQEKKKAVKSGIKRRGVGMACNTCGSGAAPAYLEHSNAFLKFNSDGSINLIVSPCEMGQGILIVLSQIAAEELGIEVEDVHIVTGDTDVTQFDIGSHASRSTYVIGNAVLKAAREARQQLYQRAAKILGNVTENIGQDGKKLFVTSSPNKSVTISEICINAIYNHQRDSLNISGRGSFDPWASRPFNATFIEVEVDIETGTVKVLRAIVVPDCGRAVNPMNVEGQMEGAVVQGIGYALMEDFVLDGRTGALITNNFNNYRLPTTMDVPEVEVIIVEKPVASGPYGARGAGELGIMGVAAAVANAIYDAVGVRITTLPITPEKLVSALKEKRT